MSYFSPLGISEQPLYKAFQKLSLFSKMDILGTQTQVNQEVICWQYEKCEEIKLLVGRRYCPHGRKIKVLGGGEEGKKPQWV